MLLVWLGGYCGRAHVVELNRHIPLCTAAARGGIRRVSPPFSRTADKRTATPHCSFHAAHKPVRNTQETRSEQSTHYTRTILYTIPAQEKAQVNRHTRTHTHIPTHPYPHKHTHTHTLTHMQTLTHTHTHTHTQLRTCIRRSEEMSTERAGAISCRLASMAASRSAANAGSTCIGTKRRILRGKKEKEGKLLNQRLTEVCHKSCTRTHTQTHAHTHTHSHTHTHARTRTRPHIHSHT